MIDKILDLHNSLLISIFGSASPFILLVEFLFVIIGVSALLNWFANYNESKRETKKQNNVKTISNNEINEEKESIEQGKKEDETGEEFIERMKKVRNSTHDDIVDSANEKEEKIFRLVDKKLDQICLNLEKDIEKDASGRFVPDKIFEDEQMPSTSLGSVMYDLEDEDGEELSFLTSMLFEKKIVTRESYKKLNKKCQELKSILEIKLKQYDDSLRTHWASPGSVTYEIIIHYDDAQTLIRDLDKNKENGKEKHN